jgi:hypothetical protein
MRRSAAPFPEDPLDGRVRPQFVVVPLDTALAHSKGRAACSGSTAAAVIRPVAPPGDVAGMDFDFRSRPSAGIHGGTPFGSAPGGAAPGASAASITLTLHLHGRAWHCPVGAKHAAVAKPRAQQGLALLAFVEELACVHGHGFTLGVAAVRAGDHRVGDHGRGRIVRRGHGPTSRGPQPVVARRLFAGAMRFLSDTPSMNVKPAYSSRAVHPCPKTAAWPPAPSSARSCRGGCDATADDAAGRGSNERGRKASFAPQRREHRRTGLS